MFGNRSHYWWMVLPAFILFFGFHTYPALQGLFYSFTNFRGYGNWEFVGFKNYINVFKDSRALSAYFFTLQFAIVATILTNIASLAIAVGLNSNIKLKTFLRAVYFIPNVLSILIVGFIFKFILSNLVPGIFPDGSVLSRNILGNPDLAWIGIVIVAVWQAMAFNTLLYLAGLQTISDDLYEAANIDGASRWQQFRMITFPLIAPFFTINMVLALKNFLMAFDHIMALTGGGPGRATESISIVIYRGGFEGGQFAYQSANAVIYFIVILVLSIVQLRALKLREN
ncbi:sugar ABC transporter permease [Loktanella sp. IMCC34160]|uniref:carbohydrate ABC transporter permease n=1 Tax=Loktanella sp. IMCC34160 TaxID=2510646 RepID=UPI00101C5C4B|nr:sugar ABC transporter permease [Loktanella sp. IMCC34160]RYG91769.1 sugar ABC transporter permease [Loktanella sp. IMCC34160]